MKTLKKIGIGLVVLILLLYLITPSAVHVERSAFINASAKLIFYQVDIIRNWEKWGPWYEKDPDMKSTYEGPERGFGSKHSWDSEHKEVGKGSLTIIGSYPFDSINTKLEFEGMNPGYGHWKFKDTLDSIRVTWAMDMDMGMDMGMKSAQQPMTPGYPQDMFMPMDEAVAKPETYGLRPTWSASVQGMMTLVRVLPPDLYEKVRELQAQERSEPRPAMPHKHGS